MDDVAVGGRLKLKKGSIVKKSATGKASTKIAESVHKYVSSVSSTEKPAEIRKTKAELAFERRQSQLQAERIMKKAEKSHKDRVAELNAKLENITEINDIPKVSWTK